MSSSTTSTPTQPANDRLNSWKEIANYLGKGVRTVQRWEADLGLPVHRIGTKGGEIVYGFKAEIDAWLAAVDHQEKQHAPTQWGRRRLGWLGIALALLLALGAWTAWPRAMDPASWRVENGVLRVFDARGKLAWEHSFGEPLSQGPYRSEPPWTEAPVAIQDLDGDGRKEVVFLAATGALDGMLGLYCFESDGRVRFVARPAKTVRFGEVDHGPPWFPHDFRVFTGSYGKASIWLLSRHHVMSPAVVQKLTPRGEVVGEYWTDGHFLRLNEARLGDRHVVLVGGTHDESGGASLAVLDYDHPSGSTPAATPQHACRNCLPGEPLAFHVFPRMETAVVLQTRPYTTSIRQEPAGILVGVTQHSDPMLVAGTNLPPGVVFYRLNSQFQVIGANLGDAYRSAHARLEALGRIKHRLAPQDEKQLFPVLSWDGTKFLPITKAAQ